MLRQQPLFAQTTFESNATAKVVSPMDDSVSPAPARIMIGQNNRHGLNSSWTFVDESSNYATSGKKEFSTIEDYYSDSSMESTPVTITYKNPSLLFTNNRTQATTTNGIKEPETPINVMMKETIIFNDSEKVDLFHWKIPTNAANK